MPDMREALEAAFDAHADDTSTEPQSTPEPTTEPQTPTGDVSTPEPTVTEPTETSRQRDALGRFTQPAQADGKGQVPPGAAATPVGQPNNTAKFEPPPRGVPVELRSNWTALTPEWRQHIADAHTKLATVEEQYRPSVEFASNFMRSIAPYQQAIQMETGGNPLQAVVGLMDTASRLRFGTPSEKAGLIAHLVKTYGVDIDGLDQALVGIAPAAPQGFDPSMVQQAVQQQLAPLMQAAQARRTQSEQQTRAAVKTELDAFVADPKNDFFEDVRDIMADLTEVADKHGQPLSLADAYQRACLLHPDVSKVMLARQQGQSAQSLTQAAVRAKAAAVSVKGAAPVGSPDPTEPTSVRAAIEAAIEAHSRV
jgi:hypothetical protein